MADRRVNDLPNAETVSGEDLFVLEQDGIVKRIAAEVLKNFVELARNGIPAGGEDGQVLVKAGDGDYDLKWMSVLDESGYLKWDLLPYHCVEGMQAGDPALAGHIYFNKQK